MRAGVLNRIITISSPSIVNGIQKWSPLVTSLPAKIEPQTGQEIATGVLLGPTNIVTSVVTIRYRTDIRPRMRVLYGTRVLEILSVIDPEEDRRQLELVCKETQT